METKIFRLGRRGILHMRELNQLFGEVFTDNKTYGSQPPSDEYLSNFLDNQDHIVIAAQLNNRVVGGLVAYCLTKFETQRKEVFLYDIAVLQELQGHGIGHLLMEKLKDVARQSGAYIIFVQADEGDRAIQFYESLGPTENLKTRNFDFPV